MNNGREANRHELLKKLFGILFWMKRY